MKLGDIVRLQKFRDYPDNEIIATVDHDLKDRSKVAVFVFFGYEDLAFEGERLPLKSALHQLIERADWDAVDPHIMTIPMKHESPDVVTEAP